MEIYKINSLYSEMVKNIKKRPYQVLRGTKTLALSSPKYHTFYKSSNDSFQAKTFKLPNENAYPKLIKSKYISLQKKINTFTFKSKNYIEKKPIQKPKSAITNIKSALGEKLKKRKNINFFVGENYYKRNFNLFSPRIKNYSQLNNLNNIYDNDYYNFYPLYSIKNSEKRVKDFFMLLNSIFYDEDYYYNDLKYNEKDIFGHKEEYINYLKDELNYFLKKEKEFDIKTDLLQLFMTKKYGKIELFLKSARIEVVEDNINKQGEILFSLNLPFHLMCLIYLLNGEQINYLIIILLKKFKLDIIKENEEENINIVEDQKKSIFLQILKMIKLENDKVEFNLEYKNYERYYAQLKFLEKIKDITDAIKYNNFLSTFFKDHTKIYMIDNSDENIYNTPNYKRNNKINFETNINKYTMYIISLEKKYKINFFLPEIELIFNDYKKQINHFIDKELFLFIYQNNFMYWDYYVLHYLFSYKTFRQFMNSILSIRNQSAKYIKKNNNYFLSKTKVKNNNINNSLSERNNNISTIIKKFHLSDLYNYEMNLNENSHEFMFFYSNTINLSLYKLNSYTIFAFFKNINKPFIYEFNFNFLHMKILYYISLFEYLSVFLKRLLYVKNDTINFDYSYFDSFSKMKNEEIFTYFKEVHKMDEENKLNNYIDSKNESNFNALTVRVCEPFIEVIDFNLQNDGNNKIVQSNIKIRGEFLNDLINLNVNTNNWINKINEYRREFDIKYHVKYEETRNKKVRTQITTGTKNKDIHKVFNKFLKIS